MATRVVVADNVISNRGLMINQKPQATLYKMAQRVLAENAGVESVRYVLPNKHYIPVDMKYIGVDNTTPYVPATFSNAFDFGWFAVIKCILRLFHFWKTSSASCCGAEDDGGATEDGSFPRSDAASPLLIYYAVRVWSTDAYPFPIFFSLILDRMRRFSPQWTRRGE